MPTISRICVAQTLHGVFGQGSRVPDTWDAKLPHEDAIFAGALLALCLRHWGRLQAYIQTMLQNPARGLPLGSQVTLAMGFAQLAWLQGVSDHAAVNESAELAKDRAWGFPPHLGLVNALLRAGARDREQLRLALEALPAALDRSPFAERVLRGALEGVAQDPQQSLEQQQEAVWTRLQEPARPAFRQIRPGPLPEGLVADPTLPGCLQLEPGANFPRAWLESGQGMVQDRSSQALMAFRRKAPVRRILDACAAPGGKTTSLALRWPEAELTAIEQHPRRARRLEENLQARSIQARIVVDDATAWLKQTSEAFDLILLDAPCSGSGTLRKHPELTWIGGDIDLDRLIQAQRSLLEAAMPKLGPEGLLVYAVCSWLPEEGRQHAAWVTSRFDGIRLADAWPATSAITEPGIFRTHPLTWDGEGFQGIAFQRA